MTVGKRRPKQTSFWVETRHLQAHGSHPFYCRRNEILDRAKFDFYGERVCRKYYEPTMGRPSLAPGVCFRCFLVGYFEGIDSERGMAYRVSDSFRLREFLGVSLGLTASARSRYRIGTGSIRTTPRRASPR